MWASSWELVYIRAGQGSMHALGRWGVQAMGVHAGTSAINSERELSMHAEQAAPLQHAVPCCMHGHTWLADPAWQGPVGHQPSEVCKVAARLVLVVAEDGAVKLHGRKVAGVAFALGLARHVRRRHALGCMAA